MSILLKNGDCYTPKSIGRKDILIALDKIYRIDDEISDENIWDAEVIDCTDKVILPGLIDQHVHILGGGGEEGPVSRVPEIHLSEIISAGVTTLVGVLGFDSITRSISNLLAKANALQSEGITSYIYTGSYSIPTSTLTGKVVTDISLIDKVIGVGEIALADYRSSHPNLQALKELASEALMGGLIGSKAGIVHIHVGDGREGITPLFRLIEESDYPIDMFIPTHINRNEKLFEQGMESSKKGVLVIIGGAEDKEDKLIILKKFVRLIKHDDSKLLVLTTATREPDIVGDNYRRVFEDLGMTNIDILNIDTREEANDEKYIEIIRESEGIFFTGGDQLRITSILGGTKACEALFECYSNGGVIAGTSAGASAMSNIMIIEGDGNEPARKCTIKVAPGLNLLNNTIIDQHFAQRGRIGRLLCGVAENPDILGIGIDEDTSIIVYPDKTFEVLGTNSVTIVDGKSIKNSNVSELEPDEILAITDITLHVLPDSYGYDLKEREVFRVH